jgi:enoyl-CoA hydratase/carnithine racemase
MSDSVAFVKVERHVDEAIAVVWLQNPPMNVLSSEVAHQLASVAADVGSDDTIRAVVLYGGERAFAAGADVKEFPNLDQTALIRHGLPIERAVTAVAAIPKPVVAAVTGVALGGGCELALAADFRVSAQNSRWGQPEILLGLMPGAGGTQRLPRLIGPARAKDLIYSGRYVAADEALSIGLVDLVVSADQVLASATEMAATYAGRPATALAASKAAIDRGLEVDLETGLQIERSLFASLFSTPDKHTGVHSFLEHGPGKANFRLGPEGPQTSRSPGR